MYKESVEEKIKKLPIEILQRMAEVKFYRLCQRFYMVDGDINKVFYFIEALSILGTINIESIKIIVQKILYNANFAPGREETILLMVLEGVPTAKIATQMHCSKRDIAYLTNQQKTNPRRIYPKLNETEIKHVLTFMGIFEGVQNLGFK